MVRPQLTALRSSFDIWADDIEVCLDRLVYPALKLATDRPLDRTHIVVVQAKAVASDDPSLAYEVRPRSVSSRDLSQPS